MKQHEAGHDPAMEQVRSLIRPTRRDFLKYSALAAAATAVTPASAAELLRAAGTGKRGLRGNAMPGRIVIYRDPDMEGHLNFNRDRIEEVVLEGVRILTSISDTGQAFESLFPGLHAGSTIAIKINLIGPCDTRWQTARGVVSGLSRMLGGTYDVSQVIIYDQHSLPGHGYTANEFTFGGNTAVLSSSNNASGSGYYVWQNHQLSRYLLNSDYVINMPVLKSHYDSNNQITVAMKNHYGSCSPSSLCGDIPGMLALNADPNVRDKTCLILTDVLRGTYNGGPTDPPMYWDGYPEQTPNSLFFSTDPVTTDYWGRSFINTERALHGWGPKPSPWIETAAGDPYNLGVADPGLMSVIQLSPTDAPDLPPVLGDGLAFESGYPNPFRGETRLRFRLSQPGEVEASVVTPAGREVRDLGRRTFAAGSGEFFWDGRDGAGRRLPAGVYFVRLRSGRLVRTGRVVLAR